MTQEGYGAALTVPLKPRHSLPHPPMFSGAKSQWRGWKLEVEGKIEEDAAAIGNGKSQLRYIYSRLEGSARTNITTFYELELRKARPSPEDLIFRLDVLYGERNRKDKAIQALHSIRQREEEPFTAFYPRFEKEIANAEAESWEDSSKISYLRNALHPRLKAHLIGCSSSTLQDYVAFATKCEEISNQMELFGEWRVVTKHGGPRSNQPSAAPETYSPFSKGTIHREDIMEWEPTTPVKTNSTRLGRNSNGYPSTRPEDRGLVGKRAKWVDKVEMNKRWDEKRCLRCGRDGCRVERCPLAAAIPPGTSISRTKVTEAAVQEDENDKLCE